MPGPIKKPGKRVYFVCHDSPFNRLQQTHIEALLIRSHRSLLFTLLVASGSRIPKPVSNYLEVKKRNGYNSVKFDADSTLRFLRMPY